MSPDLAAEFLADATTAPTETKFGQPIDKMLAPIREYYATPIGSVNCEQMYKHVGAVNRVALCAYLQGFYQLALQITTEAINVIAAIPCPCVGPYEIQLWVNRVRLARATMEPKQQERDLAELAATVERFIARDYEGRQRGAEMAQSRGEIIKSITQVSVVERAKLQWRLKDYSACEALARPEAPTSAAAMELMVRSLIECNKLDEVTRMTEWYVRRFPWLQGYLIVALLRGHSAKEAVDVLASLEKSGNLVCLRVGVELARAGLNACAAEIATEMVERSLNAQEEETALVGGALLAEKGYGMSDTLYARMRCVAAKSCHYPAAGLFELVNAFRTRNEETTAGIVEGLRCLHKRAVPEAMLRFLNNRSTQPQTVTNDATGANKMRIVESARITKEAAAHVLLAMTAHTSLRARSSRPVG